MLKHRFRNGERHVGNVSFPSMHGPKSILGNGTTGPGLFKSIRCYWTKNNKWTTFHVGRDFTWHCLNCGFFPLPFNGKIPYKFLQFYNFDVEKKWQKMLPNHLRVISTSRAALPLRQFAVFLHQGNTESRKGLEQKLFLHSALLSSRNQWTRLIQLILFICSNHHFSTNGIAPST